MALKGAKPKPGELRVIDGTHRTTRHGKKPDIKPDECGTCKVRMPSFLSGEAKKAWSKWIKPAFWIDHNREPAAIAFCELWAEFVQNPEEFNSSRHGQLRYYMSDLGLTDARQRGLKDDGKKKDPAEDYFS